MNPGSQHTESDQASDKTKALLSALWTRNRSIIEERLAILDRAAAAKPLSLELRAAALDVSHKLSGSLGMFGFDEGTVLARELEQIFNLQLPDAIRIGDIARQLRAMLLPAQQGGAAS